MKINKDLLWDHSFTKEEQRKEKFKRWYLGRVLSHGTSRDIQPINLNMLKKNLERISLPSAVKKYWQWYLANYDPSYTPATKDN